MVSRIRTLLLVMLAIAAGLPALSNAETHGSTGAVFVMTNSASGNEIIAYGRRWLARAGTTLLNGGPRQWRYHRSIGVAGIPHSDRRSLIPIGRKRGQWHHLGIPCAWR